MAAERGACVVAYGTPARACAAECVAALARHMPGLPASVVSDVPLGGADWIEAPDADVGARWAKLNLTLLTPYSSTLYLDADAVVRGDLSAGFRVVEDGWDLAICPSANQMGSGPDGWLWHCTADDRALTAGAWGFFPLVLQGGVMFFHRERAAALFAAWREEWRTCGPMDQGALLRALRKRSVRVWLLGREWNDGPDGLVWHRFGRARRG